MNERQRRDLELSILCIYEVRVVPPLFEIQKAFVYKNNYSFGLVGEVDL